MNNTRNRYNMKFKADGTVQSAIWKCTAPYKEGAPLFRTDYFRTDKNGNGIYQYADDEMIFSPTVFSINGMQEKQAKRKIAKWMDEYWAEN